MNRSGPGPASIKSEEMSWWGQILALLDAFDAWSRSGNDNGPRRHDHQDTAGTRGRTPGDAQVLTFHRLRPSLTSAGSTLRRLQHPERLTASTLQGRSSVSPSLPNVQSIQRPSGPSVREASSVQHATRDFVADALERAVLYARQTGWAVVFFLSQLSRSWAAWVSLPGRRWP
jgi:hypothetical protein